MNSPAAPMVAEHNANLLLAALPPEELARMLPALDQVNVLSIGAKFQRAAAAGLAAIGDHEDIHQHTCRIKAPAHFFGDCWHAFIGEIAITESRLRLSFQQIFGKVRIFIACLCILAKSWFPKRGHKVKPAQAN